jgi:transcriptional regulator with XRE-family HTH domain
MITRLQLRMARAALRWGVRDLGRHAGVAANTVSRFENGMGTTVATLGQIEKVFESHGIIFIPADEQGGPGVRMKANTE